jgi:NADPH-dependent ferric siderophore reductase
MNSSFDNADDAPRRQAGLLGRALMRTFLKQARVVATESFAPNFRLITLESPAFRDSDWTPGQKLQIAMGSAFVSRTYTPVDWDTATGQTRILGYVHGNGPGSEWLRKSRPGDVCEVLGPRKSLDALSTGGSTILFGDETSIGLAYALQRCHPDRNIKVFLQTSDHIGVHDTVARLCLDNIVFATTGPDAVQLVEIEERLRGHIGNDANFILTGKGQSIQQIRRKLKDWRVSPSQIKAKAYWAPGKAGLD